MTVRLLIADDDPMVRSILSKLLGAWGYEIYSCDNGNEGWELIQKHDIRLVITDWDMPGIDGLELCLRIRSTIQDHYVYIILLTAKGKKKDLISGMDAGADDFVSKPFDPGELKVRLHAGERILKLEQDLARQNYRLQESSRRLELAYDELNKDLEFASRLQKSLIPKTPAFLQGLKFDCLFLPSRYVGGDILGFFPLDDRNIAFYVLDVAGHGIASAMLSFSLSKLLADAPSESDILNVRTPGQLTLQLNSPAGVLKELNKRFQADDDTMQYFTMEYGIADSQSGHVRLGHAGHPVPIYLPRAGAPVVVGSGGFPVGLVPEAEYEETEIVLQPGDRLFLCSDGVAESANAFREMFGQERVINILEKYGKNGSIEDVLAGLRKELEEWHGESFQDDISVLAIERVPQQGSA